MQRQNWATTAGIAIFALLGIGCAFYLLAAKTFSALVIAGAFLVLASGQLLALLTQWRRNSKLAERLLEHDRSNHSLAQQSAATTDRLEIIERRLAQSSTEVLQEMRALRDIANLHNLKLLGDTAQAPGAQYYGKSTGTLADIGGFSLNYHKHIHCGEGGILVTNDDDYAARLQMIRNHAEAVVQSSDPAVLCNMLGSNFRMGEIEAAIATEQLKKLEANIKSRQRIAAEFNQGLGSLPGLTTPKVSDGCTHVYYIYGITLDIAALGVSREKIVAALRAEGVPGVGSGYQNVHLYPLFQQRIAYGTQGFPWNSPYCGRDVTYERGICPVAEKLHAETFMSLNICLNDYSSSDVALVINAFNKVWANLDALRAAA